MHEHNDPERPEAAGLQAREIVTRNVLHHATAALHHAAVARDECDAEQMILDGAEAVTERTRRRGGDDRAQRASRETGWVDAEPRAAVGELLAQLVESDSGFRRRREIGRLDGGDAVEAARGQGEVGGRIALQPGAGALDADAPSFLVRR